MSVCAEENIGRGRDNVQLRGLVLSVAHDGEHQMKLCAFVFGLLCCKMRRCQVFQLVDAKSFVVE